MRDFDLVKAELKDCMDDLATLLVEKARTTISLADKIRELIQYVDNPVTTPHNEMLLQQVTEVTIENRLQEIRLSELLGRYKRLVMEWCACITKLR